MRRLLSGKLHNPGKESGIRHAHLQTRHTYSSGRESFPRNGSGAFTASENRTSCNLWQHPDKNPRARYNMNGAPVIFREEDTPMTGILTPKQNSSGQSYYCIKPSYKDPATRKWRQKMLSTHLEAKGNKRKAEALKTKALAVPKSLG